MATRPARGARGPAPEQRVPDLSVVVCTRDRADRLRGCLEHLRRQRFAGDWELVVVDNGSTDATPSLLQEFAASAPFPVRLLREPRPGQTRARNLGLAYARAPVVAFTDDDCYPAPDYVAALCEAFRDPDLGYAGGRILLYDEHDARATIRPETEPRSFAPRSALRPGIIHGANLAFRAEVAAAIGGFDERLGPGTPLRCADDTDFIARASHAGFVGRYVPEVLVYHHHGRRPGSPELADLRRGHALGRGAFYLKSLGRSGSRAEYARLWLASWRGRSVRFVLRELQGASMYLWARLRGTLRRPRP